LLPLNSYLFAGHDRRDTSVAALKLLLEVAREERMPAKIELLLSALTLLQHDTKIEQMKRLLRLNKAEDERGRSVIWLF